VRDGGRLAAAIAVLAEMEARHRPVRLALKSWGESARYAGAKDRAFVSGLVLDVLRRRRSMAYSMGEPTDRARVLGVLRWVWDWPVERIALACAEDHGPGPLGEAETMRLAAPLDLAGAPSDVRGDYPAWLEASFERVFGEDRAAEGAALAARAPLDLRVNRLKTDRPRTLRALEPFGAAAAGYLDDAVRIPAPAAAERAAPAEAAPEFEMGWFEVQDLGSQIAAAAAGGIEGLSVLDFCAGGGGKTLALAAAMNNSGRLFAYDSDARRLSDTVRRALRAGVANLEVRSPIHKDALDGLRGAMDLVFVDAPCTGSGAWRRHPDTKWRVGPDQLARRVREQDAVLAQAAQFVAPGGRLVYVTCSVLAEENEDRVHAFLAKTPGFQAAPPAGPAAALAGESGFVRLTPRTTGTDGFFVAVLRRA
jgi:16S rRNA (cytosine967-C5)-methyltransferase